MSRGVLIAIVAGIIAAAIAAGVVAFIAGGIVPGTPKGNETQGRHLTLELDENLALKENP